MNRLSAGRWLLLLLLLWLSSVANAQSCTVSSTSVAFGVYDPIGSSAPLDGSGQITVDCFPNNVIFTAGLSTGGSGSYAVRRMASGANTLPYNLYLNAARTTVFGDGSGGTQTATCITGITAYGCVGSNPGGQGRRATLPFYGRIPAGQDVAAGLYSDTVQVIIVF
ncbi:MAG TPA: spore coat U domain-containing protein [Lysobacter sp.]|nr:spore coat U domain-containing protein [Lysobacter sp.]